MLEIYFWPLDVPLVNLVKGFVSSCLMSKFGYLILQYVSASDEFELSWAELKGFRAQLGHFNF